MKCKAFPLFKTINKVFSIWDLVTLVNGYCTLKDFLQKGKPLLALRIFTGPQSLISATEGKNLFETQLTSKGSNSSSENCTLTFFPKHMIKTKRSMQNYNITFSLPFFRAMYDGSRP